MSSLRMKEAGLSEGLLMMVIDFDPNGDNYYQEIFVMGRSNWYRPKR